MEAGGIEPGLPSRLKAEKSLADQRVNSHEALLLIAAEAGRKSPKDHEALRRMTNGWSEGAQARSHGA